MPPLNAARLAHEEVELDLESLSSSIAPQPAPDATAPAVSGRSPRAALSSHLRVPDPAPDSAATTETTNNAEPSAQQADAREERTTPIDLGVGDDAWRTWIRTPEGAPARTESMTARRRVPRPASSTGGLQEGLEERDRQLGLGPSGTVVSALYRAAHDPVAPETGMAHFRVTVFDSGAVEVSLNDATDQLPAWQAVAARAAEALKRAPPPIPKPRSGAQMLIEISAEQLFPNGVKPKDLHGPRLEAQGPRFRSVAAAQANLKDLNPVAGQMGVPVAETKANVDLPGVFVAGKGKVCGYRAGFTPFGPLLQGGCDLVNLGARAQRMVRTQVREETLF